ncbi:MAG TPA: Minf_1886 family protein, partial [Gemmatimonadaceae bacterium]
RYGLLSGMVLEYWGVRSTADLGDIVFAMVDTGLLISQPSDSREDFQDLYDFDEVFGQAYPWSAAHLA